jgi:hypothetical protein
MQNRGASFRVIRKLCKRLHSVKTETFNPLPALYIDKTGKPREYLTG